MAKKESENDFKPIECTCCERKTPPVVIKQDEKTITYACQVCKNPFTVKKKK